MRPEIQRVVELVRKNDVESVDEALALLQDTVFSFSMRVCGQRQDAEDTMQEVLLQSVPKLGRFDSPKALAVWLYKVAKTRCLMSRRNSKFAPASALSLDDLMPDKNELAKLSETVETPEAAVLRREKAKRLRDAIHKLPPEYRLVLVLRDMEELSDEDVAEITGLKAGTVRVRLHRARLFVRRHWDGAARVPNGPKSHSKPDTELPPRRANCKQMFAQLSDYLDQELDSSLCDELEKHLSGCEPCQAFLSSLERSIDECRRAPKESVDPRRTAALRRSLLYEYQNALATAVRPSSLRTR